MIVPIGQSETILKRGMMGTWDGGQLVFRLRLQCAHQPGHGPGFHLAQCERAHNRFAGVSFHQERQHFRFARDKCPSYCSTSRRWRFGLKRLGEDWIEHELRACESPPFAE
jgi:hypothetical protein